MDHDADIIIAGGGLVGGCLALALSRTPLRVCMLEALSDDERLQSPAGRRALALASGTAQMLDQLAVWQAIAPHASPIRHIHVSDRGHFGKTRLHAEQEGVEALGYVVPARHVEQAVTEALLQLESDGRLQWMRPARVMGCSADEQAAHLSVMAGAQSHSLSARLLVAADGGHSTVRRLLGIAQKTRDYGQSALVFEITTQRHHEQTAYERFTATGPLACLPLGRKRCSIVWTLEPDTAGHLLQLPEADFRDHLQRAFGYWLGRVELASSRHLFPLTLVQAESMVAQRTLLIGNAMHQLHPVAGQGFNLGLRDAAQLAEHLAVRHSFGEDPGREDALRLYARARAEDLGQVIGFTDTLVRLFSTPSIPVALMRNIGLFTLDLLPPAKHLLARHAMGLSRRLPRFS
ncbi:MAG: hypothetical protein RIQ52_1909 [Pseudomonadota bacterium]|jgi:2-octaprenyl-6-methoxyphenol hydroxylase